MNSAIERSEKLTAEAFSALYESGRRDFANVAFVGPNLKNINFAGCDLTGAGFFDGSFVRDNFKGVTSLAGAVFQYVKFIEIDFSGQNLSDAKFTYCNLIGANFTDAVLNKVIFFNESLLDYGDNACILYNANFTRAKLQGAIFLNRPFMQGVKLDGADLSSARLRGVCLSGASIKSADFAGANIEGLNLSSARLDKNTFESLHRSGMRNFNLVNLSWQDLTNWDLRGLSFEGADFTGTVLAGVNFENANLNSAIFTGTIEQLAEVNFQKARIDEVSLYGLYRQGVRDFSRVDFSRQIFKLNFDFAGCIFREANFRRATFASCSKLFAGAGQDIRGIIVENILLTQDNYEQLYLAGHRNFRGVKLESFTDFVIYSDCDFRKADFSFAYCEFKKIIGPEAQEFSLRGATLDEINFRQLYASGLRNFSGVNFTARELMVFDAEDNFADCIFRGTNFTNCDLSEVVSISPADIESDKWQNADLSNVAFPSAWSNPELNFSLIAFGQLPAPPASYYRFKRGNFFATLYALLIDYIESPSPFVYKDPVLAFLEKNVELFAQGEEAFNKRNNTASTISMKLILQSLLIEIETTPLVIPGDSTDHKLDRELILRIRYALQQSGEKLRSLAAFEYSLCERENYLSTFETLLQDYLEDDEVPDEHKGMVRLFLREHGAQFTAAHGKNNKDAALETEYLNLLTIFGIEISRMARPDDDLMRRLRYLSLNTNQAASTIIDGIFPYSAYDGKNYLVTLGNLLHDYATNPQSYPHKAAVQDFLKENGKQLFSCKEEAESLVDIYVNLIIKLHVKICATHAVTNPDAPLRMSLTDELMHRLRYSAKQGGLDEALIFSAFAGSLFEEPKRRRLVMSPFGGPSRLGNAPREYELSSPATGSASSGTAAGAKAPRAIVAAISAASTRPQTVSNAGAGVPPDFMTAVTSFMDFFSRSPVTTSASAGAGAASPSTPLSSRR